MHLFASATIHVDAEVRMTVTGGGKLDKKKLVSRAVKRLNLLPHKNLKQLRKRMKQQQMSPTARGSLKKLATLCRLFEEEVRVLLMELGSVRSYFCCQTSSALSKLLDEANLQEFIECLLTCLYNEEGEEITVTSVCWEPADYDRCRAYFEQVQGTKFFRRCVDA
jgi:hypothetical protein